MVHRKSRFFRFSALLFVCALANPPASPCLASGLAGHWTFDESRAPGKDSGTAGKDAVVSGAKTAPGLFGAALDLSLAAKSQIIVPQDILPDDLKELTFSIWLAPRTLDNFNTLFRKEDVGKQGDSRLYFAFQENGKFLSLGLSCGENYAECDAPVSPAELCDGNWHHAAGTFDGSVMRVYLDGREIGSFPRQVPLTTIHQYRPTVKRTTTLAESGYPSIEAAVVAGQPLFIGSFRKQDFFDGKLDDARFYSKALSRAQIAALHSAGRQPENPAVKTAQEEARRYYTAAASTAAANITAFEFTLEKLGAALAGKNISPLAVLELHRLLRADFPEQTNDYILKWQRSPLSNLLLTKEERTARIRELAPQAFEYLPLTPMQWNALSRPERAHWERARLVKEKYDSPADASGSPSSTPPPAFSFADVFFLESLVEERPSKQEPVAKYKAPSTPPVRERSSEETRKIIEEDWLFQCDNKPTVARSLQEIAHARKLAARFKISSDDPRLGALLGKLDDLEARAKTKKAAAADKELYFSVRDIKRQITFANPALDFDSILYIDNPYPSGSEWNHETRHYLGYMAVPGGRLILQKGLHPDGKLTKLLPQEPLHGSFWRPDLSYDATRILVSFKPHNEKTFHLYEINTDGTGFRQLTGGMFDDLDPIYLPDGKNILFTTTRGHNYVRCMPPTNSTALARMSLDSKPGDKSLYIVSRNGEPEYTPALLHDGRVLYTRWEYTDKSVFRAQSLWTMNQNATNVQTLWGNQSVWPDLPKDARPIPGSNRILFTGSAHHNWFSGCIGIIDPSKGLNFPNGLAKVTQELPWPESGNGPVDPKENDTYHTSGKYTAYYSPYPLGEKDFLVSASRGHKRNFVLLLMDTDGNRELVNEGEYNIWNAIPVRKRPLPPVQVDTVNWPSWETRAEPATGHIYSNNVYENAPPELKDKAKYLRIWSIEAKTYTFWSKRDYISSGPAISAVQAEGVKKIIGTVPIEPDGSVSFNAPSGIPLHFQLLDENQRARQTMKSFTGVQPGETRACFGCHEQKMNAPVSNTIGKALRRAPSNITPVPWEDITVGYERYVQPVLDKYCGNCHADETKPAFKKFNSKLRAGFLSFKEPYMTLVGWPTWGTSYKKTVKSTPGGFGWADILMVESYHQRDPAAYTTPPPMTRLSYKSRLVECMSNGKHHNVKVSGEDLLRVILWVDALAPYMGAEEVRKLEDPRFQGSRWLTPKPRLHTAPLVQRPGPFDTFHPDEDPAYFAPDPSRYNALPFGVTRQGKND
jgi:hypothetical protein